MAGIKGAVPRLCLLGVDILILVALGTSEFQFNRLLEMLDLLCDEGSINGDEIVAQIGCSTYMPRNYQSFGLISHSDYQKYLDQATCLIVHGGTGCVVPALKQGKKVIAVPRQARYGEHVDDHQFDLVDSFSAQGLILKAVDFDSLKACLKNIAEFEPVPFASNSNRFNDLLIDFIRNGSFRHLEQTEL